MQRVHELDRAELFSLAETLPLGHEKKVAHNTYVGNGGGYATVRYHATTIAVLERDGSVTVNSGGWQTPTTKLRLNALLPGRVNICQEQFRWFFWKMLPDGTTAQTSYVDYANVRTDGTVWFGSVRIL